MEEDKVRKKRWYRPLLIMLGIIVIFNIIAFIKPFCDWYTNNIYPLINNTLGFLTGWIPFALGEMVMYVAILAVIALVIIVALLVFLRKKSGYKRFTARYAIGILYAIVIAVLVYTFVWVIPFRCTVVDANPDVSSPEYSIEYVSELRNYVADLTNRYCLSVERDSEGFPVAKNVEEGVVNGLKAISDEFPRFKGHYSPMKKAGCSAFLEWMWIGGYTYPFTMELTWNKYVSSMDYPVLYAHELAHHKGYYKENEGNFFSYIGCINSDNDYVKYCGLISLYFKLDSTFWDMMLNASSELSFEEYVEMINKLAPIDILDRVYDDINHSYDEASATYDEEVSDTFEDAFQEISSDIATEGWDIQSDVLGDYIYDKDILLVLEYFYQGE